MQDMLVRVGLPKVPVTALPHQVLEGEPPKDAQLRCQTQCLHSGQGVVCCLPPERLAL